MLDLYRNIKKRRIELELTQSDLAEKLGYADKSMIAKIEKGIVDLPQSKIVSFAEALETTPAALMGWTEHSSNKVELNQREQSHLLVYRSLTDPGKDRVDSYTEKVKSLEADESDQNVVETFQKRLVARNGNKNLSPSDMRKILEILDNQ